jgi:hypothetical protein
VEQENPSQTIGLVRLIAEKYSKMTKSGYTYASPINHDHLIGGNMEVKLAKRGIPDIIFYEKEIK